jgi:thymidylate kinase
MSKQIRGIILEGQSCSGKTSIFNAIKQYHLSEENSERNVIYLSEHYSQTLNFVNGKLQLLTKEENLKVLGDRISMLETLNNYANSMGEHSRRSRGLFYVFERFHLNYACHFNDTVSEEYSELERRLIKLNAHTFLFTISPDNVPPRLKHRETDKNKIFTEDEINEYINYQQRFIDTANKSKVKTTILNTDSLNWTEYAKIIFSEIR